MANKGRGLPPHLHHPLPAHGIGHPDPYASAIRHPPGGFPPFEMLPPHEVMEHKLSAQHTEIEKLATENQRLAATHGTLRQDLAAANHELQLVHSYIADMKSAKEQQMRGLIDKMSTMEAKLESAEPIKMELQKARAEAQSLVDTRKELISKAQQLNRDLQMAHPETQQIPSLMSELDGLRQEYQHCRGIYEYEKKLYNDHLESLQVMEKNHMAMSREVEKLRAELMNTTNFDPRTGAPYGGAAGYSETMNMGNYPSDQNSYGVAQGQSPLPGGSIVGGPTVAGAGGVAGVGANSSHAVAQSAAAGVGPATPHDASRGPSYNALRGTGYDPQHGQVGAGYSAQRVPTATGHSYDSQNGPTAPSYDAQWGPTVPSYDPQRVPPLVPGYNAQRGPGAAPAYEAQGGYRPDSQKVLSYDARNGSIYDGQKAPAYDVPRSSGDDVQKGANYDASAGGTVVGSQGQVQASNVPYASSTPSVRSGTGYNSAPPQGGNPARM